MLELKQEKKMKTNNRVHYAMQNLIGTGVLLGFSGEFPTLGKMWIVLLDNQIEWDGNIWKAIVLPESCLRMIEE
jgi:hypothetical protein